MQETISGQWNSILYGLCAIICPPSVSIYLLSDRCFQVLSLVSSRQLVKLIEGLDIRKIQKEEAKLQKLILQKFPRELKNATDIQFDPNTGSIKVMMDGYEEYEPEQDDDKDGS